MRAQRQPVEWTVVGQSGAVWVSSQSGAVVLRVPALTPQTVQGSRSFEEPLIEEPQYQKDPDGNHILASLWDFLAQKTKPGSLFPRCQLLTRWK